MWLVGGPGIGKTVLAKYLIESLRKHDGKGKKTIYFFCDRKKKDEYKAVYILRCLIYQCMTIATKPLGRTHVKPRYEMYGPHLLSSDFKLARLFVDMMSDPGQEEWYCIIDALDDCEEGETKTLLEGITKSQGYPRSLRLLITSRPCGGIKSAISNLQNLKVVHFTDATGKQLNEADIAGYISDHVGKLECPTEKKPSMEKQLVEKAAGSFTWAVSMIRQVAAGHPDWYNELLAGIPSAMADMVDGILSRAKTESLLLLQLLAVVERPLSVTELATLITLKKSPFPRLFALGSTAAAIRDKIQFGEEALKLRQDEILFFHPSMPKQLREKWTQDIFRETHLKVAEACLIYLNSIHDSHRPLQARWKSDCAADYKTLIGGLPLLEYSAVYWPTHLRCAGSDAASQLWPFLQQCLSSYAKRELSFQVYRFWHHDDYIEGQSILHILALHNLTSIVRPMLAGHLEVLSQWHVNDRDSSGRTPLWWAVEKRHKDIVSLLLKDKNVNCNIQDLETKMSPPVLAIKRGFTDIVMLFLETESSRITWSWLNSHGVAFTALYWAATANFEDLVVLLLPRKEFSQDLERPCANQTPLVAAARNGYSGIVQALLEYGAQPNSTDEAEGLSALSWAARNGHKGVVDCLLRCRGVDVNLGDRKLDWSPFQWAAAHSHEEIASSILSEMCRRWGSQAPQKCISLLLEAAEKSQLEALKILLRRGDLMPDSTDRQDGRTALSLAAEHGQIEVVQQLIGDKHTNVNSVDRDSKTPLMWAADKGHVMVVKVLVNCTRVEVNRVDSKGRSAYDWARMRGKSEVCKLLKAYSVPLDIKADLTGQ
jgi:ankyrin repeat protein